MSGQARQFEVELFADGACSGNPGPGGWGVLLRASNSERELSGAAARTTNNRMELRAVIEGLNAITRPAAVSVYTDSQYVQKGITEWMSAWKARGWRTADRKPVKNEDLWRALEEAASRHRVRWHWVRGHAGHEGNERADALARQAVKAMAETE